MTKKEWDELEYGAVVRWDRYFVYMYVTKQEDGGYMAIPLTFPIKDDLLEMARKPEGWELLSR